MPFLVLMAESFGEGPSHRSKRGVETPREPSACQCYDQKEFKMEEFDKRVIVYENLVDVEDLENHFEGFQGLVQIQSWEVAFMSAPVKKIALPQIKKFYYILVKVNDGYYKAKVKKKDFHLRSGNIAQLLGAPNDGDKTYFDNVQLEHLLSEFMRREELNGTVVTSGTILSSPMKTRDPTKMALIF